MADTTELSVQNALKDLHPERSAEISEEVMEFTPAEQVTLRAEDVVKTIANLRPCTAPGTSGLRSIHIKSFWLSDDLSAVTNSLTPFLENIARGNVPPEAAALIGDGNLVALEKDDGGVRPIAILELLRNLAGGQVLKFCRKDLRENLLASGQLGVAVEGGCEMVPHAVRAILDKQPGWLALLVDFKNMFNEVSRAGVLDSVRRRCPAMLPFLRVFYARHPKLSLRIAADDIDELFATSEQGVMQGCALGTAAAACLLADFQDDMTADAKFHGHCDAVQLAIADDLTILAGPSAITHYYQYIAKHAPNSANPDAAALAAEPYALKHKMRKCKLYSPKGAAFINEQISNTDIPDGENGVERVEAGCRLVGAPLGSDAFAKQFCSDLVDEWQPRLDGIASMKDKQVAQLLLRLCHTSRPSFIMRTCPPELAADAAKKHDNLTKTALATILDVTELTDDEWAQAQLPLRHGGCGMWSMETTCSAAYAGSWALSLETLATLERNFWPTSLAGTITALALPPQANEGATLATTRRAVELSLKAYDKGVEDLKVLDTTFYKKEDRAQPPTSPATAAAARETTSQNMLALEEAVDAARLPSFADLMGKSNQQWQSRATKAASASRTLAMLKSLPDKAAARLLSASGSGAAAFLTAVPTTGGLRMHASDMSDAIRLRLGVELQPAEELARLPTCPCCGDSNIGSMTNHLATCKVAGPSRGGWTSRSRALQDITGKVLNQCGFVTEMEEKVDPTTDEKRSDIVVRNWPATRRNRSSAALAPPSAAAQVAAPSYTDLHLDNAVTHAAGATGITEGAHKHRGRRAKRRATEKHSKYDKSIPAGSIFKAAIVETYGHIDHEFKSVLRTAAESHANKSVSDLGLSDNARAMLISQKMQDAYTMISVTMQASFVRQIRRSAANIRSAFATRAGLTRIDAITQNRTNATRAHIITYSPPGSPSLSD